MEDYKSTAVARAELPDGIAVFCRYDDLIELTELKPNPGNPNMHPDSQLDLLGEIIRKTGWRAPITISKRSGLITKGHGRRQAAMKAGLKWAPVEYQDYASEEEEHADLIADNRIAELAEMDSDKLTAMLEEMQAAEDFPLELTGLDEAALDELLGSDDAPGISEDDDDVPDIEGPEITKPGDVWRLGRHRLMCGDSTDAEAVKRLMDGETVDLYLTDPPYNVGYVGKTKDALTIENDKMDGADFRKFLVSAFTAADGVMREGAPFYIWHADLEGYNFRGACADIGWQMRECLIWVKDVFTLGRQDYQWRHEPCIYGWKAGASHKWYSDRKQTTCIEMARPKKSEEHPTMKPVGLFAYQIQNSSLPGAVVLDSFGGSGTTIIACEDTGRTGYCVELSPHYCDVIVRRYVEKCGADGVEVERGGEVIELSDAMEAVGATL